MLNELVEDNKGIIGSYKIDGKYIYVYYLDKYMERYDYSESTIKEINEKMINQAIDMVNFNEKNETQKKKMYNAISIGLMCGLAGMNAAFDLANQNTIRLGDIIIECIGMGIVPLLARSYLGYMALADKANVEKYSNYLKNYRDFNDFANSVELYEGIENKGTISINTIDSYTLDEVNTMCDNISRIRKEKTNNHY